jgi:hypothetical protein
MACEYDHGTFGQLNTETQTMAADQAITPAYKRVLLKISGESFCREGESGISMSEVASISQQIKEVVESGVQLAIVCGGGNILRGKQFAEFSQSIVPSTAHYMGMLATVINGLALQDALESAGVGTRLMSAIRMEGGGRAIHSQTLCPASGKRPRRYSGRGDWQPIRHNRHRCRTASARDRRRYCPEGHQG